MTIANALDRARDQIAAVDVASDDGFAAARRAVEETWAALVAQGRANVARTEYARVTGADAEMLVDDPVNSAVAAFGAGGLLVLRVVDDNAEILARFSREA